MYALTFLAIRAAHVLMAALWIGSTVFAAAMLLPAVDAAGVSGGQVMQRLNRRGSPTYMSVIALTTMMTGVYLLWRFTGGFDPSVIVSRSGLVFGIGGAAGILAGVIGGGVVARSGKNLASLLGSAVTEADDHTHRALLHQVEALRRRMKMGLRAVIVLQTIALVFMSVGHYV